MNLNRSSLALRCLGHPPYYPFLTSILVLYSMIPGYHQFVPQMVKDPIQICFPQILCLSHLMDADHLEILVAVEGGLPSLIENFLFTCHMEHLSFHVPSAPSLSHYRLCPPCLAAFITFPFRRTLLQLDLE